jgi:hypothetical protein
MQQVHRILVGSDKVKSETWLKLASDMERATRAAANPLDPSPVPRSEKELLLTESAGKLEQNTTSTEAGLHSEAISQCIPETQANGSYRLMKTR